MSGFINDSDSMDIRDDENVNKKDQDHQQELIMIF